MFIPNFEDILVTINRIKGVENSIVAGLDGIPVGNVDRKSSVLSASTVAALGAVRELTKTVSYGNLEQLIVETDYGKIIVEEICASNVIIVLTENNVNIGMIRVMIKKAVNNFINKK